MITLDAERAGEILGVGRVDSPVLGVSTDTRTLLPGDLFVALVGERFDGHDYVAQAFAAGASGAVVAKAAWQGRVADDPSIGAGPIYSVDDTLVALGVLAREVRRVSQATVFAITGSAGKTSTKDMLECLVGRVWEVIATRDNENNEVGVPQTLLRCRPDTEAAVVEMGMRGLGQIDYLASIAEPDVGMITNVHPVHTELLGSLENVARAKAELVEGIRPGGAIVVPSGTESLERFLAGSPCRVVRFCITPPSSDDGADVRANEFADIEGWVEPDSRGGHVWTVRWSGGEAHTTVTQMSRHALENATAAAAACWAAGLSLQECMPGINDLKLSEGRGQTVNVGGVCVIDDTYNANPAAVRAAIEELVRLKEARGGRAVAVLGDMLELGADSAQHHEYIGRHAAAAGVSVLWGVGPMASATVEGFSRWWHEHPEAGQDWRAEHLESSDETEAVVEGLQCGDVVLVKGSRGVRLENVVIRVLGEARSGRWAGGEGNVGVDDDLNGEMRHC